MLSAEDLIKMRFQFLLTRAMATAPYAQVSQPTNAIQELFQEVQIYLESLEAELPEETDANASVPTEEWWGLEHNVTLDFAACTNGGLTWADRDDCKNINSSLLLYTSFENADKASRQLNIWNMVTPTRVK